MRHEELTVNKLQVNSLVNGNGIWPFPHRKLFVDPGGVLSEYGLEDVYLTLAAAEEAAVANQHDTIYIVSGSTSLSLTSSLTWDKSYTHLVGCCAPAGIANRARIFNSGDLATMITISASGCVFSDFYMFQGGSDAADLGCVDLTGGRNYFKNVHFAGIGHATPGAEANAYSLKLNGAEENMFRGCTVGVDTITRSAANRQLMFDASARRNQFEDCNFLSASSDATAVMVEMADTSAADRFNKFKSCMFYNFSTNHGTDLDACFKSPASMATNDIILQECMMVGITEWQASDRGNIWVLGSVGTAGTAGVGSSGQCIEPS